MSLYVQIVDTSTGASLGPNEVGEIRIRHQYQMAGYLGDPKATAETFDEDRFFKTGDLGYITQDQVLYLTGRIKALIKFRNMQVRNVRKLCAIMPIF